VSSALVSAIALGGLGASLAAAVGQWRRPPAAAVAVVSAAAVLLAGGVSVDVAIREVRDLLPVVGFLVAVLVLAHLAAADGLFDALGDRVGRRAGGNPKRLFGLVFAVAAGTTVVLSLDTTVVLLAPVVLATVARARVRSAPHQLVTVHLANSASLLLPVSNLSNLLAVAATGVGFLRFTALMAAPAVVAVAVEFVVLRLLLRADLAATPDRAAGGPPVSPAGPVTLPRFASTVLAATLGAFVVCGALDIEPVWPAAAGALVLLARAVRGGRAAPSELARASSWDFAVFVLGIAVVVAALAAGPVGSLTGAVLPAGNGFVALLEVAVTAAVLANVVNNLPATLLVLGLLADRTGGVLPVLAALVGLNVGPNLTYQGSLATLLWRRIVPPEDRPGLRTFAVAGLATVPVTLVLAVAALWAVARLVP